MVSSCTIHGSASLREDFLYIKSPYHTGKIPQCGPRLCIEYTFFQFLTCTPIQGKLASKRWKESYIYAYNRPWMDFLLPGKLYLIPLESDKQYIAISSCYYSKRETLSSVENLYLPKKYQKCVQTLQRRHISSIPEL